MRPLPASGSDPALRDGPEVLRRGTRRGTAPGPGTDRRRTGTLVAHSTGGLILPLWLDRLERRPGGSAGAGWRDSSSTAVVRPAGTGAAAHGRQRRRRSTRSAGCRARLPSPARSSTPTERACTSAPTGHGSTTSTGSRSPGSRCGSGGSARSGAATLNCTTGSTSACRSLILRSKRTVFASRYNPTVDAADAVLDVEQIASGGLSRRSHHDRADRRCPPRRLPVHREAPRRRVPRGRPVAAWLDAHHLTPTEKRELLREPLRPRDHRHRIRQLDLDERYDGKRSRSSKRAPSAVRASMWGASRPRCSSTPRKWRARSPRRPSSVSTPRSTTSAGPTRQAGVRPDRSDLGRRRTLSHRGLRQRHGVPRARTLRRTAQHRHRDR